MRILSYELTDVFSGRLHVKNYISTDTSTRVGTNSLIGKSSVTRQKQHHDMYKTNKITVFYHFVKPSPPEIPTFQNHQKSRSCDYVI